MITIDNCDPDDKDANAEVFVTQHIRRQYEAGHRLVAKVLAADNSSFTQVHILDLLENVFLRFIEHEERSSMTLCSALRRGLLPGSTWLGSWKILLTGFSHEAFLDRARFIVHEASRDSQVQFTRLYQMSHPFTRP